MARSAKAKSTEPSCSACKHWLRDGSETQEANTSGYCRRYPPLPMWDSQEEIGFSAQPQTEASDVCGEFFPAH